MPAISTQFRHLFTPFQIGSVEVRNRLMITSHWNKMAEVDPHAYNEWYMYGERAMHYWTERSKGGWGLIIAGQAVVHESCGTGRPSAFLEESIPRYRPIAASIHKHGAKVFVQINHLGRHRSSDSNDWQEVWGPSSMPVMDSFGKGQLCKAMEKDDIAEVVRGFAVTASNLQQAGFDGVEVHAAHDYLLDQFLTPLVNKRTDEYGGSLENRMRLLQEVIAAIRQKVGRQFVVGVRLDGIWPVPGGHTSEEMVEVARRLEQTGQVDFINVTAWPIDLAIAPAGTPLGQLVSYAQSIRESLDRVAVFAIGRVIDPAQAEKIVSQGYADMVAMTRASIADPELPNKAREGRLAEIRQCTGSGQGCLGGTGGPISCTQNATAGREEAWGIGTLKPAPVKRRVLVVGGGPAGMEAAIVAAQRGHQVTLAEKSDSLGGQVRMFLKVPRREEFGAVIEWRHKQLALHGVEVKLNTEATPEFVAGMAPDEVILATGSVARNQRWYSLLSHLEQVPGGDLPHVFSTHAAMQGAADGSRTVLVVDDCGYYQSSDPLEYFLNQGAQVYAVSAAPVFAAAMVSVERSSFVKSLRGKPVTFHPQTMINRITPEAVEMTALISGKQFTIENVDAVIFGSTGVPDDALYFALKAGKTPVRRIGDCLSPRGVEHAVHDGHAAGRAV